MGKVKFFFVFLLVLNLKLFSQVAIEVVDDSEDMVGQRLVFKVKEKFASSSIFRLTYKDEPRVQSYNLDDG
jgi:outer membrane protein assembly factor BamA